MPRPHAARLWRERIRKQTGKVRSYRIFRSLHLSNLQSLIGTGVAALILGACGSLPTTMNSLSIPSSDSVGLGADPIPSPLPTSPLLHLTPELRARLQVPEDHPALLIYREGSDVIAQLPANEVIRWIGAENRWSGIEGIDLRLSVGEYRETASAQLRLEQPALFTFSDPPQGSMTFEATAFAGTAVLAQGKVSFDSSRLQAEADDLDDTQENDSVVPLLLSPADDVPFLQGLALANGQEVSVRAGVVQDPLSLNRSIILLGRNLDRVSRVLFATVVNPSGMTSRQGEILEQSEGSLRVRPPQGLALTTTTVALQDPGGVGLGTLSMTWKQDTGPSPSTRETPAPIVTWTVEPVTIDGLVSEAALQQPGGLIVDGANHLLVTDRHHHQILVLGTEGKLEVWAGTGLPGQTNGSLQQAQFHSPTDLAWTGSGDLLLVDQGNHQIRRISLEGQVSTVAGTGTSGFLNHEDPLQARFNDPSSLVVAPDGSVFVADSGNHRIRQILPSGQVRTVAGTGTAGMSDGLAERAQFNYPTGLALDQDGSLWIADRDNHRIRQLTPEGQVLTVTGSEAGFIDGDREGVRFNHPTALAFTADGSLLITDRDNHRIRRLSETIVTTLAGSGRPGSENGPAAQAQFQYPRDLWVRSDGSILVIDDSATLRRIVPHTGVPEQLSRN